jgi:hypothetical protein
MAKPGTSIRKPGVKPQKVVRKPGHDDFQLRLDHTEEDGG